MNIHKTTVFAILVAGIIVSTSLYWRAESARALAADERDRAREAEAVHRQVLELRRRSAADSRRRSRRTRVPTGTGRRLARATRRRRSDTR